jgi:outer membrane protein TolC
MEAAVAGLMRYLAGSTFTIATIAMISSAAAEPRRAAPVKLDDLVAVAVRQSPTLARARVDRTAAKETVKAADFDQQWVLKSELSWRRMEQENIDLPPVALVAESVVGGQVSLARRLPTGGALSLSTGIQRSDQEYEYADFLDPQQQAAGGTDVIGYEIVQNSTARAQLSVEQPLFRGAGPDIALSEKRRAELASDGATAEARLAAEEMLRDLVTSYWELAYATHELEVRQRSLTLAKAQLQTTQDAKRAGTVPAAAVKAVQYQLAVREEATLRAQIAVEARSLELRRVAGLEIGRREVLVVPGERFEIDEATFDLDDSLDRARRDNARLAVLLARKRTAQLDVDLAEDLTRPRLDVGLSGAMIGQGEGAGEAFGELGSADAYEASATLTFSFELGGAANANVRAASERRRKVMIDAADIARAIETEVVASVHAVAAARERVRLADAAISVAEDNLGAERANFLVARTSNFAVLERQDELIEAHLRRGRAISDYHQSVARLEFLTGDLLDRHGVEVQRPRKRRHSEPQASE